ncbi:MAG TPA: IclR family transcriptional regulator [Caldilineaceae bacterium]|nr:IclR family transcriptional regulator [Caldilineaceae bacterium]
MVPAVDRAIDLLQEMARAGKPLTLAELSERTATSRSTAFNTLATLQAHGFVEKNARFKTYRLGLALFELGNAYLSQVSLTPAFMECAEELVAMTSEAVKLAMRDGRDVVYLATLEGPQSIHTVAQPGARFPAHATAVGKVLLAQLPAAELAALYADYLFPARTPHTLRTLDQLDAQVDFVRQHGYAVDREESTIGLSCLAAPVYDHTGAIVAAMSIGVPNQRCSAERLLDLSQLVMRSARQLSHILGWQDALQPAEKVLATSG